VNRDDIFEPHGWRQGAARRDREFWTTAAEAALEKLAATVGFALILDVARWWSSGDGFSVDFFSSKETKGLQIRPRGILGAEVVEDQLLVRSWVFLYSASERLTTNTGECLLFQVVAGAWQSQGWIFGESGEFDHFAGYP
jgi:hypothetical protein